jgi:cell division protein DivIC
MVSSKIGKKTRRRLFLLVSASIIIISIILFGLSSCWFQIYKKIDEKKFLKRELLKLESKEANLKSEIQKLQDPDYIARYAREKYLYSKDGEFIIRIK